MTACMIGWSHTRFGKLEEENLESLIVRVTCGALENAGIEARAIDAIFVSHMNGGFVPQTFVSSLPLQADPGLRFKPATRVENACASGSAAVYQAIDKIEAGNARIVLVVGAEKMTALPTNDAVSKALASASYTPEEADRGLTFPGIFASMARQYFERYGDKGDVLARIAAKNHANGALTDCSTVADGAAALVLADSKTAAGMKRAVAFRSRSHVNDFLPMSRRDMVAFEGPSLAWQRALEASRLRIGDLSFAEVHDCFTIAELLSYEAMGLAPKGQGERAIVEGWTMLQGRLPVNPSGGLKAKGHPIGATGVSMHVMAAMQLVGEARDFQVREARFGGVFNMGGSAVANYVSVLEPLRA
jgi:acetyl-CoA C-acetyltransferase